MSKYPRRYCLGLIEAGLFESRFPQRLICIRGVIASASLKRVSKGSMPLLGRGYPRRYCLGLIEAVGEALGVRWRWSVSEALSPRPH